MSSNVRTVAVKEHSLEELDPEYAKDEEEGAADNDDVADGLEAGQQGLHYQLETRRPDNEMVKKSPFSLRTDRRPVDDPERTESSDQAEHAEHPEQTIISASRRKC